MNFVRFYRRPVSLLVTIAFTVLMCFWANQAPAAPRAENGSETAMANAENEGTGFLEQEKPGPVVRKGKKVPWLVIGAVVVVGAAAIYFLALKKPKYDLNVTMGQGCSGTPAATASYKKNAAVSYSYSVQSGYSNLQVKLDGNVVAASGSVTMDKAHALDISAAYGAGVTFTSTPSGARIYDNQVDTGKTTPATLNYTAAGSHTYLLRQCGYKDYTQALSVQVGQNYTVNPTMVPGILDDFLVYPSCWVPNAAAVWTVSGGIYKCASVASGWDYSLYNTVFGSSTFTVEAKMNKVKGAPGASVSILLTESTDLSHVNGYHFDYLPMGYIAVYKETNSNWITHAHNWTAIRPTKPSAEVIKNLNRWNVMKIVRSGSSYSYYMNGKLAYSFTDASFNPRVVVLNFYTGYEPGTYDEVQYEYVKLDIGG